MVNSKSINIVFRADASMKLASGHIMRCLTLAHKLKHHNQLIKPIFICNPLPLPLKKLILKNNFQLFEISKNTTNKWDQNLDIEHCKKIFKQINKIELLIVDHYHIDIKWELALQKYYNKICVIDDLANRHHYADYLIDQTFARNPIDYQQWLNPECQLLIGQQYILLRDEFHQSRQLAQEKRKRTIVPKKILVSLGGVDSNNLNNKIIEILAHAIQQGLLIEQVVVVISSYSKNIDEIKKYVQQYPWLICQIDSNDIASLMLDADIAIGASGSSAWERCCLGLPTLAITLASNQQLINHNLTHKNAIINLGHYQSLDTKHVLYQLNNIFSQPNEYQAMVENSFNCCDGLGTDLVASILLNDEVSLKEAQISDIKLTYEWQSTPEIRKYSRNTHVITWHEHKTWFTNSLNHINRHMFIIEYSDEAVGILRLDKIKNIPVRIENKDTAIYEVSILITPKAQRKKIALKALHAINKKFHNSIIYAYVKKENIASQKLFKQANYKQLSPECFIRPAYILNKNDNIYD